jgi:hypothetical protein
MVLMPWAANMLAEFRAKIAEFLRPSNPTTTLKTPFLSVYALRLASKNLAKPAAA